MTRDDIIRMAREVGFDDFEQDDMLERFANLAIAAEREECAKVCEVERERLLEWGHGLQVITADKLAKAIQARGEK